MSEAAIEIRYEAEHTASLFHACDDRVRGVIGPVGCVAGDTIIMTERGPKRISQIDQPMRVLSWNAMTRRFQLSLSGGAFPKGRGYLYRVTTQQGEFVAAGHHLILCADGEYRQVNTLCRGQSVLQCSDTRASTTQAACQKSLREDDPHWTEKVSNYLGRCADAARLYGQRFLSEEESARWFAPSRGDAQTSVLFACSCAGARGDDHSEPSRGHSHRGQFFDRTRTDDCATLIEPPPSDAEDYCETLSAARTEPKGQQARLFLPTFAHRLTGRIPSQYSHSYSTSVANGAILRIELLSVQQSFWDMQVMDTNNYVTIDGAIHHNSGKSVMCVLEIIMRSLAQAPHNGVRRTRWGVIRNTYPELKTTTLKTWQDWVPPNVATIKWDQPITAKMVQDLPDGTKIDMEVLFVSVDRPADVKKLLSLELTGAWINEAREISKSTLDQLTARIARFPSKREGGATWSGIIMDTNPPDTDHWWYKTFETERPPGYTIFHQPPALIRVDNGYRANPEAENACNHSRGHYYWLDLIAGKTEEWIKVYVLGQYGTSSDGKPVYPEWVDSIHTAPDILLPWRGLPLIMGWDCSGLRPAVVFGQVTNRGQIRILDELLAIDMGIKQFAADIVKPHLANKYPSMTLISVGDPAGKAKSPTNEATIYDELRKAGLDTMPASTNLFVPRREAVAGFLTRIIDGEPGFLLSPNCENLRQGFNGKYYYKRIQVTGEERWKDEPADNDWTHLADALQYCCLHVSGDREMKGRTHRRDVRKVTRGKPVFFR